MSEFSGGGFPSFPNLHGDRQEVSGAAEWSIEKLEYKINEYGAFLQRKDPMPRAVEAANRILDLLLFEAAYRDDVYTLYTPEVESGA